MDGEQIVAGWILYCFYQFVFAPLVGSSGTYKGDVLQGLIATGAMLLTIIILLPVVWAVSVFLQ